MFKKHFTYLLLLSLFLIGCSSSVNTNRNKDSEVDIYNRFGKDTKTKTETKAKTSEKIKTKENFIPITTIALKYNTIRVLLSDFPNEFSMTLQSDIELSDNEALIAALASGTTLTFSYNKNYIRVTSDTLDFKAPYFTLNPVDDSIISYDKQKFRGSLRIVKDSALKLLNILSIDDYVKGVIPGEMPTGRGLDIIEAVKAFAICARTYAYNKIAKGNLLFDVYKDTRDQVYMGYAFEKPNGIIAVETTKDMVLSYNGNLCTVFYSSTCGGFTEDVEHVFGKTPYPYLKAIKDADGDSIFCSISPAYSWKEEIRTTTISKRLLKNKLISSKGTITDCKVLSRYSSNRINEISITVEVGGEEKQVIIKGGKIRTIFAPENASLLKSSNFEVELVDDTLSLTGLGYGHGVGLCQFGAIGMAKHGYSFDEILNHYFNGSNISKIL